MSVFNIKTNLLLNTGRLIYDSHVMSKDAMKRNKFGNRPKADPIGLISTSGLEHPIQ